MARVCSSQRNSTTIGMLSSTTLLMTAVTVIPRAAAVRLPPDPPDGADGISWLQQQVSVRSFKRGQSLARMPHESTTNFGSFKPPAEELIPKDSPSALRSTALSAEEVGIMSSTYLNLFLSAGILCLALALRFVLQLLLEAQRQQQEGPACQGLLSTIPVEPVATAQQSKFTATRLWAHQPPLKRLSRVESSFVLPLARIARRPVTKVLTFDIPMHPGVKPFRAILSPSATGDRWAKIDLTIDVMSLFGLPPLLTCEPASVSARLQSSGSTGGTGSLSGEEATTGDAAATGDCKNPWLQICNANGAIVASITPKQDGHCIVQRQDHPLWNVNLHHLVGSSGSEQGPSGSEPLISVSRESEDIAQATPHMTQRRAPEKYVQVDSQFQAASSETPMLLMCMLAALAFHT